MIEVNIDSVRVSLMSDDRLVILREIGSDRHLPIFIGQCEAEAIAIKLRNYQVARPLTHDLLKNVIAEMGGELLRVVVNDLRNDVFHATLVVDHSGRLVEIDARPSDALALAVRAEAPIFVDERVMEVAGIAPERDLSEGGEEDDTKLSAFRDFVDNLDLDDLPLH
jgi:bifunctional DNase/RNase